MFPEWMIEGSYSSDPGRREKIEKLRTGGYSVIVTTSILERGVTVPDAQVIVLEANHDIFDERALVQMAGRVGRTRENPQGRALFLARRKTSAIQKAIDWIQEQNNLALEQGLIE
ncbi:ComF operon protein 1 [bioreactor metagenome]|uniref:ComF operon protein 1 n=1 Tax=bioreactor metagenome TaxID=1076179 RepID=A0A645ITB6_9ZZZZ